MDFKPPVYSFNNALPRAFRLSIADDEAWREVSEARGYLISSYGQVYSWRSDGALETSWDSDGIPVVHLTRNNGPNKSFRVRRLVASAFDEAFFEGCAVINRDNNVDDNRISNLECVSRSVISMRNLEKSHERRRKPVRIVATNQEFDSIGDVAAYLRVSTKTVRKLLRGEYISSDVQLEWIDD